MILLMDIEVHELAVALVQGQLDDLTRMGGIPPTDDERAEFILWGKLQAAMEAGRQPLGRSYAVLWRDSDGPGLAVRTTFGWLDENLERKHPPMRVASAFLLSRL